MTACGDAIGVLTKSNMPAQAFSLRTADAGNAVELQMSRNTKPFSLVVRRRMRQSYGRDYENKFREHQPARRDHIL